MPNSHITETLYVSQAVPATNDAAGFEALTWTLVNGLQQEPQLGISHNNIDVPDLTLGFTQGIKGAGSGNDSQMTFYDVAADAGQAILIGAARAAGFGNSELSIKIVRGSGTDFAPVSGDPVQYAQGYAHSYLPNQGTDSSFKGFTANFKQNAVEIDATEPV